MPDVPDARTLPRLFETSVERHANRVFLLEKRGGRYEGTTYVQARAKVHRFAAGLAGLGLQKGDRVALIAEGRNDWVIAELGILYCGAVNVPISVKIDELADLKFRLMHAGCKMAIVSQGHVGKIRRIRNDLPDLQVTVVLDAIDGAASVPAEGPDELPAEAVFARGDACLAAGRAAFDAAWRLVAECDAANICYTSGTTADPKGIVLTHRNYTANVEQGVATIEPKPDWVLLNVLPWDHAFGHTCGIYMMMSSGAALASVQAGRTPLETLKNIPVNIRETRPTIFLSVPAIAKSFRKNIEKGVREKGRRAEALFARALHSAYAYNGEGWNRGAGLQAFKRPLLALYDRILFRRIRENFGGRLRFFVGGGALLDLELQRFFYAIGIPMLQGYGLTEAAPVISANTLARHKLGSSGRVLPDVERADLRFRRERAAQRRARRDRRPRRERHGRVLEERIGNGGRAARRVVVHRRPRLLRCGRLPLRPRAREEPADCRRWREVQPGADRGGAGGALAVHRAGDALQQPVAVHGRVDRARAGRRAPVGGRRKA